MAGYRNGRSASFEGYARGSDVTGETRGYGSGKRGGVARYAYSDRGGGAVAGYRNGRNGAGVAGVSDGNVVRSSPAIKTAAAAAPSRPMTTETGIAAS